MGGVAVQGEDEIASIGMCIGATLAGARAMTATSGPGISLYSENIGLAIIGEVPLVIVDVQRLGPATGGATTVGQGDVQFVRWGTAGGYPIIALAPSSVAECYSLTRRAFDLAERFRCPVFLLTDKELNMTTTTVEVDELRVAAGSRAPGARGAMPPPYRYLSGGRRYRRSPSTAATAVVRFTGSTHDERALITKAPAKVAQLNEHLRGQDRGPRGRDRVGRGRPRAGGARRCWSATASPPAPCARRCAALRRAARRVSALTLQSLWPVPERAIAAALAGVKRVVVAELNHGQYRREIERAGATAAEVVGVHRVDGELIAPAELRWRRGA